MKARMRGADIPPFYAGEIGLKGLARARKGHTLLSMNFGQPTAGAPTVAIEEAHRVLDAETLGYYESVPLRERLVQHYQDTYGVSLVPEQILLTVGASAALVAAFSALFQPGDRIALVQPGYPAYRNTLRAMALEPVEMRCAAESGFKPTVEMLESIDPRPDGFVLASPANPTGAMLSGSELALIVDYCQSVGITLISDEIYHGLTYGDRAVSALEIDPDSVVINSFSKLYRMPGWRLGWMVVPYAWAPKMSAYLINMFLTPPTLSQYAALAAMDVHDDLHSWVDIYRQNRDRLIAGLDAMGITGIAPPEGAFYLYADVGHVTQDSLQFCLRLVEETGIALAPGIDFDPEHGHRFIRFSFAVKPEEIEHALQLLGDWLPSYTD